MQTGIAKANVLHACNPSNFKIAQSGVCMDKPPILRGTLHTAHAASAGTLPMLYTATPRQQSCVPRHKCNSAPETQNVWFDIGALE